MTEANLEVTRRHFIKTAIAMLGAAALPLGSTGVAQGSTKYTRFNVTSEGGKKALSSYAKGVAAMLKLPADHPQNWFRNAFIHLMDCPHGNWWFYVWHRAYLGYFEQTIRSLSGDSTFALPYWDWTTLPQIPDSMFDGVLTPRDAAFEPFTGNLSLFTSFLQPALESYWKDLSPAQLAQLNIRGYTDFSRLWNDVTGYFPPQKYGISGNMCYAVTCNSRYLTRDNPKLDDKTAYNVSAFVVYSGLLPNHFYNPEIYLSFNSSKTPSHNTQPGKTTQFSVLEGLPHNKVHNYIGGVGPFDPGPYGNMTNFLSPVDPVFFLHHANIDRLWDVWTRKQKHLGLPYLPTAQDLNTFSNDPFLFFVNGKGEYIGSSHAGEYLSTDRFEYDYEPGFGEKIVQPPSVELMEKNAMPPFKAAVKGSSASLSIPGRAVEDLLAFQLGTSLMAEVTLPWSIVMSSAREFDVLVGAPPGVMHVDAASPYYAGTIAFFGNMMHMMGMPADATFAVPLPKTLNVFQNFHGAQNVSLDIRIVPSHPLGESAPQIKALSVRAL